MPQNTLKLSQWKSREWETENRLYHAEITQDLFGDWIVMRSWRGKEKKGGGQKTNWCETYDQAHSLFDQIEKRRLKRGYHEVHHDR